MTDWTPSIENSLMQMQYYDYDIAVVVNGDADDESGLDFVELMKRRKKTIPVIIVADREDDKLPEKALKQGAVDFFIKDLKELTRLPESIYSNIIKHHAVQEQDRLNRDLMDKNREMKSVNDVLARQSVRFLKLKKEQESQRNKMESLLNAMVGGVVFINSQKEIELLNPAARLTFRLDEDDTRFNFDDLLVFIGFDPFSKNLEPEISGVIFSREYRIHTTAIREEDRRTGRMLFIRDVTIDREVEKLKAEFQSMISHELRTPLAAIQGAVENFQRGNLGPVTDEQSKFLAVIKRNVKRQTGLVNDMLDLAKLEALMMSPEISRVDPEFVVRLSYEAFQYAYKEKGLELSMELNPGIPKISADEKMLSQVLDNLLSNALKFTPKGGKVKIELHGGDEKGEAAGDEVKTVLFRVTDNGPGVPDNRKEKVFDRYYQMDSSETRSFKGTGLGLAICRKMAELHNGSITCTDAPGGGASFALKLPVATAARKKIMLVGGDPVQQKIDEEVLGKEFLLVKVDNSREASAKIAKTLPQLLLIDYHIPEMNGLEIFAEMKTNPATARIPVIFVSEKMAEKEKVQALKMGASDIVSRPYNAGEFLARVKRVIGS